jgi:hypothetical protein
MVILKFPQKTLITLILQLVHFCILFEKFKVDHRCRQQRKNLSFFILCLDFAGLQFPLKDNFYTVLNLSCSQASVVSFYYC